MPFFKLFWHLAVMKYARIAIKVIVKDTQINLLSHLAHRVNQTQFHEFRTRAPAIKADAKAAHVPFADALDGFAKLGLGEVFAGFAQGFY